MAKKHICWKCGERFSVSEAREMIEIYYTGDHDYDEEYPEHDVCGECAITDINESGCGTYWPDYGE